MTRPHDTRTYRPWLAATLACPLVLAVLVGCGAREGIPRNDAKAIAASLDDVEGQFRDGDCTTLTGTGLPGLQESIDALPRKVDEEIRKVLSGAVADLDRLATECEVPEPEPITTTTQSTTTTAPVETEDDQTTTDPVTTETEEEEPVEPEIPNEKPGKEPKLKPPKGEFPDAPVEAEEDDG